MKTGAEGRTPDSANGASSRHESKLALLRINDVLEEQSRRIAHAVHDEAGQLLAAVFVRLDQASRELSPSCGSCFEEIKRMLQLIEAQLREIAHDLRPTILDDLGLVPALRQFAERVSQRHGISIAVESEAMTRLSPAAETTLYRIVQEALNNVVKHAGARRAVVRLKREDSQIRCSIQDDGAGFDLNEVTSRRGSRGLGLVGIRERVACAGGVLFIESVPGNGTTLSITIPAES